MSLAVADTLEAYRPKSPITLKWPNDVLLGGAKVAGLLLEREGDTLLIGIGINLLSHPDDTPYPATHLVAEMHEADLAGPEPLFTGAEAVLALLAARTSQRIAQLRSTGFVLIRRDWEARAHGLGDMISVNGETGTFDGIGPDGALCLVGLDGTKSYVHAGDVSFGS